MANCTFSIYSGETDAAVVQKLKAFLDEIMLQLLDVMEQRVAAEVSMSWNCMLDVYIALTPARVNNACTHFILLSFLHLV